MAYFDTDVKMMRLQEIRPMPYDRLRGRVSPGARACF